ncbi:Crp/Fnr family transcriptional regulator [Fibrella forsythiae]|uniref:Crp/Fnr family transcriptional regulator n=1 Tax=Fibrella forsythiae TaxID=2817061 RepID=A0ABS3JG63_9BACT|nr:Crp/Fnr family transcriptional regulator [Fibrella forsythiae]MBO0948987.1 Crp/Fnr family transcriptional regulator [Fibrella forsythiae]
MHAQNELINTLNRIYPLSPPLEADLRAATSELIDVPPRTILLRPEQVASVAYFVVSGLARVYAVHGINKAIDEQIREVESTTRFSQAGDLLMAPISFFRQQPSLEVIQTLEESVLVSLPYATLQTLYHTYPTFNIIGRVLTERYFLLAENRAYCLRRHTAPEKWAWFKVTHPQLQGRIPLKYIATYLGLSREHLQRLVEPAWRWQSKNEKKDQV